MKDLVYRIKQENKTLDIKEQGSLREQDYFFADVETLEKYRNNQDIIYQVITEYDTYDDGQGTSVRATRNLDKAFEILKNDFFNECSKISESKVSCEDDLKRLKSEYWGGDCLLKNTYGVFDACEEYITMYITVSTIE